MGFGAKEAEVDPKPQSVELGRLASCRRTCSGECMRHRFLASGGFVMATCLAGCGDPPSLSNGYDGPPLASASIVLLNNLQVSGLGRIEVDGHMNEVPDIALGVDPVLSMSRDSVFALVRDQNVLYEVDPGALALTKKFVAYEDAELSPRMICDRLVKTINPQDVAIDGDGRLWVTRLELPTVAIIEPDGSFSGTVDLSAYADADGLPEAYGVHVAGDRAYVAIERLDRCGAGGWIPTGPGVIVEIDIATRMVVKSIELGGANPFGRLVPVPWDPSGNTVAVALAGHPLKIDTDDAAAIVDLQGATTKGFGRETELGGSVVEVVLAAPDEAYMIVSSSENPTTNATSVVRIDPQTGQVSGKLLDSRTSANAEGGYCHRGLAVVGEHVLVGSQIPCETGVIVLERQSGQRLGLIPPAKLPPIAIQAVP